MGLSARLKFGEIVTTALVPRDTLPILVRNITNFSLFGRTQAKQHFSHIANLGRNLPMTNTQYRSEYEALRSIVRVRVVSPVSAADR